jgi:hypothetical protein
MFEKFVASLVGFVTKYTEEPGCWVIVSSDDSSPVGGACTCQTWSGHIFKKLNKKRRFYE